MYICLCSGSWLRSPKIVRMGDDAVKAALLQINTLLLNQLNQDSSLTDDFSSSESVLRVKCPTRFFSVITLKFRTAAHINILHFYH